MKAFAIALAAGLAFGAGCAQARPLKIVAAENMYGDLAGQIGGAAVEVLSLLTNPDQDPHLFEASPQTARAVADARIFIVNGADYDAWTQKLAAASPSPRRIEINIGALVGVKPGANPHLWYSPAFMATAARALEKALAEADPAQADVFAANEKAFEQSLQGVESALASLKTRFHGVAVAASEPVFGYAAQAAGLDVREEKFALAVMNDAEPSPSDVAAFEDDLKGRKVRALIFNAQASEPAVERLVALAKANGVPVVPVTETEPPATRYQDWVKGEIDALDRALSAKIN